MTFRAGQRVICVNNSNAKQLELKKIYTVYRSFGIIKSKVKDTGERGKLEVILLYEAIPDYDCMGFDARRFRPAVERPTDISIFTKMLIPKKEDA